MKLQDIKLHSSGRFSISKRNWKDDDILHLEFYSNYLGIEIMIDTFNVELGKKEVIFKEPIQNSLNVVQNEGEYIIKGDTFEITIDESTGLISDGKYNGKTIIKSGPYLHLIGAELGTWKLKDFSVDVGSDIVLIRSRGTYGNLEVRHIDNQFKVTVNTHIESEIQQKQVVIYEIQGLEDKEHTIKVEAAGGSSNIIVVDAFEISTRPGDSYTESAKLIINTKWNYPSLAWGNYMKSSQTLNNGDVIGATIYLNNNINIVNKYSPK